MQTTVTYRIPILFRLIPVLAFSGLIRKDIRLSVQADQEQGDGGVDVTGAPNSRPVEGAGFGRLPDFYSLATVKIGGSNFGAAGVPHFK
jgi:hypothetical protein